MINDTVKSWRNEMYMGMALYSRINLNSLRHSVTLQGGLSFLSGYGMRGEDPYCLIRLKSLCLGSAVRGGENRNIKPGYLREPEI